MKSETLRDEEIRHALDRVLNSTQFKNSPIMGKFLTYIVEETLAGNEDDLKAYSIAVDAMGRSEEFDAQSDPAVRVLAGRLRTGLSEYYRTEGHDDTLVISVPTGISDRNDCAIQRIPPKINRRRRAGVTNGLGVVGHALIVQCADNPIVDRQETGNNA